MNSVTNQAIKIYDYTTKIKALSSGCFSDPFSFLGLHEIGNDLYEIRMFLPGATKVTVIYGAKELSTRQYENSALFVRQLPTSDISRNYKLKIEYPKTTVIKSDPYSFNTTLENTDLFLFNEGTQEQAYNFLGAHFVTINNVEGIRFTIWAPNAKSVSVIGEFNYWQKNQHYMKLHPASGVWELFIPDLVEDIAYKFSITTFHDGVLEKADPFAFKMQQAPGTASVTHKLVNKYKLSNTQINQRNKRNNIDQPISIYEVHLGSWKRRAGHNNQYLTYRELADELIAHVKFLGFTHIQLMPISEYPFDGSWGYQPVGLFAPTSRFGSVEDFGYFVQLCHIENIGLLIDWVPGHFPSDPHGLHKFDGTHLFEHADKRQGFHPDWNTYIYNYDRPEVKSFLISNAMFWIEQFKVDGLRVDAVASMLYLDYSRKQDEWIPNHHGGRENLGAIDCLKQVNQRCYGFDESIMMIAEESTAWPGVTKPVNHNGLGFGFKWNMGWMNDSLSYMRRDPVHKKHHHNEMTFSMVYAHSENYILPLSHDEVVHGKGSLLEKMPGDEWQQFANLRAYYAFMFAHPGKKLLFMGSELAQRNEWDHDGSLDWELLESESHRGIFNTIKSLNTIYKNSPALYRCDNKPTGFSWIDSANSQQSIFSFIRCCENDEESIVVISNFTPMVYHNYQVGVPSHGKYKVLLNTDDVCFYGSGVEVNSTGNLHIESTMNEAHGYLQSVYISIPPLATVYLKKVSG